MRLLMMNNKDSDLPMPTVRLQDFIASDGSSPTEHDSRGLLPHPERDPEIRRFRNAASLR